MHLVSVGDLGCTTSNCPEGSYGKALADKLKLSNYYGWTSTLNPSDSCLAYYVELSNGLVNVSRRSIDGCSVLCVDDEASF